MIGNDVIDILQSRKESNWQRKGFIEKLFTIEEQLLISNASNPEIMVWMLWSMKEAAYKIYNRKTKRREYIPQKLVCSIISQNKNLITGNVICSGNLYHTQTILSDKNIHTIAVNLLENLNHVIEIEKKSIIKDKNGIPYWINSSSNTMQDVSISHHGRFEKVVTIKS
ncbi:4-phosphopantetheinyl transferase family protein [Flavobacterium sp. ANB]|uniref:4'-phosphopantetheinyl transferase superfamily protein n=1 Tax=unclassified Flavobacterium TaxID=196869 RepID=UPI0012B97CD6|nr:MULTISPECIES: 4'-phosphopantetheinyl transferase superfamily protein [unclassified Flavobacterium]MBF4516967.1 4-phosphopantetheinyl transferase family protein [Flavobacterium sp. ANB]MTD69137.1 4'-phosphopantetheinyl transferase superfamily protein [Flavobacterium sp. LC2016-13]